MSWCRSRLFVSVITLLCVCAAQLHAREGGLSITKDVRFENEIKLIFGDLDGRLDFRTTFRLSTLLNEPIVNCTAGWELSAATLKLQLPTGDMELKLTEDQIDELDFYGYEVGLFLGQLPGNINASGTILCDAGVLAHKDREPFNVAGSPVWKKTVCINKRAGIHCGESPGSRWANEAEAREIVAYLIATYPAGSQNYAGLDLKIQAFRVNSSTLVAELIEENAAAAQRARKMRQLREVFQGLKDMGNFPERTVDRLMQELEYESETDEDYLAAVDGYLSATGDHERFDNIFFPITEHAFVRMQPILQAHARQTATERTALDTWDEKVSTISRASANDYEKWHASLKEPEIKRSDEYTIVNEGSECRYMHPVTGERAFAQFVFRNCYVSSVEYGWALASSYGDYQVHFLNGEKHPAYITTTDKFSQDLLSIYTSGGCNYLNKEGLHAFDWDDLPYRYPHGCGTFGPDSAPLAKIKFGSYPERCGYVNPQGDMVIGPFDSRKEDYACGDFDHKTGLAKLEHRGSKTIYTINAEGERVGSSQ